MHVSQCFTGYTEVHCEHNLYFCNPAYAWREQWNERLRVTSTYTLHREMVDYISWVALVYTCIGMSRPAGLINFDLISNNSVIRLNGHFAACLHDRGSS